MNITTHQIRLNPQNNPLQTMSIKPRILFYFGTFVMGFGLISGRVSAQNAAPGWSDEEMAKLESAKVGLITTKLSLTPDQAKEFWPVYNEFNLKRRQFRKTMKALMYKAESIGGTNGKPDDELAKDIIKKIMALKTNEAVTESEYADKFLRILKPNQVLKLYGAEKEVMRMLFKEMGHGKHHHADEGK